MQVIVIGAGILGSSTAWQLARAGAEVTVIEAGQGPAVAATGASFGWINASFHLDEDHYRLRAAGIDAWHALADEIGEDVGLDWTGALWFEGQGAALRDTHDRLRALGYDATRLDRAEIAAMEPALAEPPDAGLLFGQEGIAEPVLVTETLLRKAGEAGARILFGLPVRSLEDGAVVTDMGRFEADRIVVAAGTATPALLAGIGVTVPLVPRPALVLRTAPMARVLRHTLITPEGEIRQDRQGRIVMPTTIGHQSDTADWIADRPDRVADAAADRLRRMIRAEPPLEWADVTLAWRPYPQDGRPVIGACSDRVYATVMHSGMTLAAITAELAAAEILDQPSNRTEMLAPYRPDRF